MNTFEFDEIIAIKRNSLKSFNIENEITPEHLKILAGMKTKKSISEFIFKHYLHYNKNYLTSLDLLLNYFKYRDMDINKCSRKPKNL
jgi:hypothetical protein